MMLLSVTKAQPLSGEICIQGAKNSALPILAAALVCRTPCVLENCPALTDTEQALEILQSLGCRVRRRADRVWIDASAARGTRVPAEYAGQMRASVLFLGALLARHGQAQIALPGGCPIGLRPVDLHLHAFRTLGMEAEQQNGELFCRAAGCRAACVRLRYPSVGATENALLAALRCPGRTLILNAAREPEICDLCRFLRRCGARIGGEGGTAISVEGGSALSGARYRIMPDRMEAASFCCMAAACGGEIRLRHACLSDFQSVASVLRACGCSLQQEDGAVAVARTGPLRMPRGPVRTGPFPAFATDAQAVTMAALLKAEGACIFEETVFEDRFLHVPELRRLGADIAVNGASACVTGVESLRGAYLTARDLRGAAAMTVAALTAEGRSYLGGLDHLRRGYSNFEQKLRALGAQAEWVEDEPPEARQRECYENPEKEKPE